MRSSTLHQVGAALIVAFAVLACRDNRPSIPTTATPVDGPTGQYSLTVTAECRALPEDLRSRSYLASIEPRTADNYIVTLSGARFLADEQISERSFRFHCSRSYGLDCNQFTASREGDQLRFRLAPNSERFDDEFAGYGGMIVELIPPDDRRLEIGGTGVGRLDGATIQASIDGSVWSCPPNIVTTDECAICNDARISMTFIRR
jgi:hypothetical protein